MYQGNSKKIFISVIDDDNQPLDLTGCTIRWGVRKKEKSTDNLVLKETPDITTSDNLISIELKPSDTSGLPGGKYYHECKIIDVTGNASTVSVGMLTIDRSGL